MEAYIIVSYGDDSDQDYIGGDGDTPRKIFISKNKAKLECKKLQKEYDLDQSDHPYDFIIESVEIIE